MERVKREKNGQHEETFEKIKMFSQFLRNLKDDTLIAHRSAIAHPSALLVLFHVSLYSFKLACNLPFHLLPLAPLPSSPGSPSPSIYFSLLLFKAHLLFLSISHTI